jgi:putative peptidoglycan lipid II flippase
MKLYRGFATVGTMTILSRVLGFARDVLIAAVLGTSYVADAFFVAFRIPNMFRRLFAEGAFDSAFIPLFAKRLHADGPDAARKFAGQALSGLVVLHVAVTVLAEIAMPWLMLLLAPGFSSDPDKFALAVLLARIALPYLAFMSVVALYTGVLNAYGRFAIAAFAPTLLNVMLIAVLLAFLASRSEAQSTARVALAWGIALSGLVQVIVVVAAAAKIGMRIRLFINLLVAYTSFLAPGGGFLSGPTLISPLSEPEGYHQNIVIALPCYSAMFTGTSPFPPRSAIHASPGNPSPPTTV